MIATPAPSNAFHQIGGQTIPNVLIHEIIDGNPYYRKGYRDVLSKTKSLDDIMGSSSLQFFIIEYLLRVLFKQLDEDVYIIATNEAGMHLDRRNNLAGDILVYDKKVLTPAHINKSYAKVPPKIAIEIDVNIEIDDPRDAGTYIALKTQKLLDFGVEKVIWFLTESKKVIIAESSHEWEIKNWDAEIEILGDIHCNVGNYLREKGSEFA